MSMEIPTFILLFFVVSTMAICCGHSSDSYSYVSGVCSLVSFLLLHSFSVCCFALICSLCVWVCVCVCVCVWERQIDYITV